jgi:elongation factor P--beta-lysine ligase
VNQALICGVSVFMDSVSFLNLNPKQNIYSLNRGIMILISMNIKIIKSTNFRNQEFKLIHNIYFTMLDISA